MLASPGKAWLTARITTLPPFFPDEGCQFVQKLNLTVIGRRRQRWHELLAQQSYDILGRPGDIDALSRFQCPYRRQLMFVPVFTQRRATWKDNDGPLVFLRHQQGSNAGMRHDQADAREDIGELHRIYHLPMLDIARHILAATRLRENRLSYARRRLIDDFDQPVERQLCSDRYKDQNSPP